MSFNALSVKAIVSITNGGSCPTKEDYLLIDREKNIFTLADGFGGEISGAQAAKTTCECIRSYLFKEAGDADATMPFVLRTYFSLAGNVLFNSILYANSKVNLMNKNKNIHEKGGASVISGFMDGNLLALANVGACSAWLMRNHELTELVIPRSYQRLVNPSSGYFKKENQIPLMAVGMSEDLEPEIFEYRILPGDWVLMGSGAVDLRLIQEVHQFRAKNSFPSDTASQEFIRNIGEKWKAQGLEFNASILLVIF